MRLVFYGSPETAVVSLKALRNADHQVELIITQPDRPSGRGRQSSASAVKRYALENSLALYQPNRIRKDPQAPERIAAASPDLAVVVAYGQIIPNSLIQLPRYNSINLHFSLLPKYRGASPVQWALLHGEQITGISIFELNAKMDEGDILCQREFAIQTAETALELEGRLAQLGSELLVETIARIDRIQPVPQDHSQATLAPLIKKEQGRIDWTHSSLSIEHRIRAFTPWPSTFTFLAGKRLKILKARAVDEQVAAFSPGDILNISEKGLTVGCGGKSILLIEILQPENKKAMSPHAYSLGGGIKPGNRFS